MDPPIPTERKREMLYTCSYLLAQVGWYSAVKNRKILSASQIPLFLFCLEILFLYLFSFAGWLKAGCWLLNLLGCGIFFRNALQKKLHFQQPSIGILLFLIGLVWAFIACQDAISYTWSDMSHWMRYAKALYSSGGFPTAQTHPDITYSSYPPGSALFITYLLPMLPMQYLSGKAIFAQKVLHLACLSAIVSPIEQMPFSRKTQWIFASLLCILLLGTIQYTYSIMVDIPLGLLAAAILCIPFSHTKDPHFSVYTLLPICCCLVLFKSSGILFLLLDIAVISALRQDAGISRKKLWSERTLLLLIPLIFFGSWMLFSRFAYPETDGSMQALSLSRFYGIFSSHTLTFYLDFPRIFLLHFFSFREKVLVAFWCLTAAGVLACLFSRKYLPPQERSALSKLLRSIVFYDVVYTLSLFLSYLFSFTETEALELASFPRYFGSLVLVHSSLCMLLCLRSLCTLPADARKRSMCLLTAGCLALILWNQMYLFVSQDTEISPKVKPDIEPNDWYIRQLNTAVQEQLTADPETEYVLWLLDRTEEPEIRTDYKVGIYCRIALSSYFCLPMENVRVLDLQKDAAQDVEYVLRSYTDRENALVVVTDRRPGTLAAAQALNIPVITGTIP